MDYSLLNVDVDQDANTALVRLNRPDKKNALNHALRGEMCVCLDALARDDSVHAVVITGNDSIFSAGLDLNEVGAVDADNKDAFLESVKAMFVALIRFPKPVISAISGPAYAGGFDLACLCDIRIASETARFQQTEVIHGITQLVAPHWMCVGLNRIKELAWTGQSIDAWDAYRIGLVNHLYTVAEYLDRALDLAHTIAGHDPRAVQASKRMITDCLGMNVDAAMQHQFLVIGQFFGSAVSRSSARGFVDKNKK